MRWSTVKMLLALKCDESTRLISLAMEQDLSPAERWAVRLHTMSCESCRRFRRQIELLRQALNRYSDATPEGVCADETLSEEARGRIAKAISDRSS